MKVCLFDKSYQFQFIDYVHGGCDISVSLAVDFSISNLPITNPQSLHYMPKADKNLTNNTLKDGSIIDASLLNK